MKLIVPTGDDEILLRCRRAAKELEVELIMARDADNLLETIRQIGDQPVAVALIASGETGIQLIHRIRSECPSVPIIGLGSHTAAKNEKQAIGGGVIAYLPKSTPVSVLRATLVQLMRSSEAAEWRGSSPTQMEDCPSITRLAGVSYAMRKVFRLIYRVAPLKNSVLILGESGTGKELVARSIHEVSRRRKGPFIPVDCASLVLSLLESELFGYIRGAFTGAGQQKRGLIEAANGGTLFLDEIGDLPIDAQAKLLRVLQEHEIRPVGGLDRIPVDFRLISATNQDLDAAVKAGKFRQDLYFRLNVVQLRLPPLRERRADIPLLAANMIAEMADPHHARRLGEDVMRWMATYDWPGNVRELEHAIERALALSSEPVLHLQDFFEGRIETSEDRRVEAALGTLGEMKHRAILAALRISGGDVRAAARILGISNTTMYRKVQEIRLESETTGTGARDNLERHG